MEKVDLSTWPAYRIKYYYDEILKDHEYACTISMAIQLLGEKETSLMLQECEKNGKRIKAVYDEGLLKAGVLDCPYTIEVE